MQSPTYTIGKGEGGFWIPAEVGSPENLKGWDLIEAKANILNKNV